MPSSAHESATFSIYLRLRWLLPTQYSIRYSISSVVNFSSSYMYSIVFTSVELRVFPIYLSATYNSVLISSCFLNLSSSEGVYTCFCGAAATGMSASSCTGAGIFSSANDEEYVSAAALSPFSASGCSSIYEDNNISSAVADSSVSGIDSRVIPASSRRGVIFREISPCCSQYLSARITSFSVWLRMSAIPHIDTSPPSFNLRRR